MVRPDCFGAEEDDSSFWGLDETFFGGIFCFFIRVLFSCFSFKRECIIRKRRHTM